MSRFCPRAFFLKALAAEATVSADSMSAVSLLAARLLRNLIDTVVKDGDRDPAQKSESDNLESESGKPTYNWRTGSNHTLSKLARPWDIVLNY